MKVYWFVLQGTEVPWPFAYFQIEITIIMHKHFKYLYTHL